MSNEVPLKQRIETIKYQIDCLEYECVNQENTEDLQYEKDSAASCLDDALEVVERDLAYRDLQKQLTPV